MNAEPASILVYVGPGADDAIGENFMKLPFLRMLRTRWPAARIAWMHGEGPWQFEGILAPLANGLIDEFLPASTVGGALAAHLPGRRPLAGRRFDLIVDMQKNPRITLALRRVRHGTLISPVWRYALSSRRPPAEWARRKCLAEKLLGLAMAAIGEAEPPSHVLPLPAPYVQAAQRVLPDGRDYVGFAPGAGNKVRGKCWPLERFLDLARAQRERGRMPVFVMGAAEDEWRRDIEATVPDAVLTPTDAETADGTPVGGPALTVAIARRLRAAVANCSGTGHMLAAGGAPMVSLYGPTDPAKFRPYTPDITVLRAQDFGGEAMNAIPGDAVAEALEQRVAMGRTVPPVED